MQVAFNRRIQDNAKHSSDHYRMNTTEPANKTHATLIRLVALLLVATALFVRIRLLNTPLERDEGEYAYMGQLLLKGVAPYTHAYTMKLPGVSFCYALFMSLFGQSAQGIRTGLLLVNGACALLVYLLGRRLFSRETAVTAAAFYVLLSLSSSVLGIFAHATHLVVLFSLAGILLLDRGLEKAQPPILFASGFLFGMAFLMKQHAAMMILFALLFQIWPQRDGNAAAYLRKCATFLAGTVTPYGAVALWIFKAGAFDRFWFWTVRYAREYASGLTLSAGLNEFALQFSAILRTGLPIWLLAGAGIVILCRGNRPRREKLFLVGYLAASSAMVIPGFYFRAHYFVMVLPPVALLAASAVSAATRLPGMLPLIRLRALAPVFLLAAASGYPLVAERDVNFTLPPLEVSRLLYGTNPFPEAEQIAALIRGQTREGDRVAILGSEPEILFYADRLSATGHIYMYGLMENHPYAEEMQRQLISEIEAAAPAYIVVVHHAASWLLQPGSLNKVLDWGDSYIPLRYDEVCIVEIFADMPPRFITGAETAGYTPAAESFVSVFRRR